MAVAKPADSKWADVATVKLIVGEAKTAFLVHESVLFEASSFFKTGFTSMFRESSERSMPLPEDDESIFNDFVDWLYHGRYEIPRRSEVVDIFLRPVMLSVLADKYRVPGLQRLVLEQMSKLIKSGTISGPSLDTVAYAYEHTLQNAEIRKMLADAMIWNFDDSWYQQAENQTWLRDHPEVSIDVIVHFAKYAGRMKNPFVDKAHEGWGSVEGLKEDPFGYEEPLSAW